MKCETYCKEPMDYVRIALAIETLAYHNKKYLWTGDNCKLNEEIQSLLTEAIKQNETVDYQFNKIMKETGLDPKCFYDLVKLVDMCR